MINEAANNNKNDMCEDVFCDIDEDGDDGDGGCGFDYDAEIDVV